MGLPVQIQSPMRLVHFGCHPRTQRAWSRSHGGACRPATLAGSACIQMAWRTARTLWEHLPCGVLRGEMEPGVAHKGRGIPRGGREHGSGSPAGPTDLKGLPDLADAGAPFSGVTGGTHNDVPPDPRSPGQRAPSSAHPVVPGAQRGGGGCWTAHAAQPGGAWREGGRMGKRAHPSAPA